MSSNNYVVLITGANRGLGWGLLDLYLRRPHTTVIAANRDITSASSQALKELPRGEGSEVVLVQIESTKAADPARAVRELQEQHGIERIDLAVANAGISDIWPEVSKLDIHDLQRHLDVNVYGVIWLWQAVLPLLRKAKAPKFVTMSSSAGSLAQMELRPFPNSAYGTSKAVLNYLSLKMHFEEEHVCVFPVDPGWVQTDLGNYGAVKLGLKEAEITLKESVDGMFKVIEDATREKSSGKFMHYTGITKAW